MAVLEITSSRDFGEIQKQFPRYYYADQFGLWAYPGDQPVQWCQLSDNSLRDLTNQLSEGGDIFFPQRATLIIREPFNRFERRERLLLKALDEAKRHPDYPTIALTEDPRYISKHVMDFYLIDQTQRAGGFVLPGALMFFGRNPNTSDAQFNLALDI